MKLLLTVLCLFAGVENIYAQRKLIVINPGEDIITNIPKEELYAYRQFVDGTIHHKNGKTITHKMNYNILFDENAVYQFKGRYS